MYRIIMKSTFPIMAPALKIPPSRYAWNPIIFKAIGSSRAAAKASRLVHNATSASKWVIVMNTIRYPEFIIAWINSKASTLVYISAVGAGKTPSAPKIGLTSNKVKRIFTIQWIIFFIPNNYSRILPTSATSATSR